MDRASDRASAGVLLGAAVLAAGMILPHSAPHAATPTDGVSLFTPGLGCGPAETLVGTGGLLARVRAGAASHARLPRAAAKAVRPTERRHGAARQAARLPVPSRSARKAPRPAGDEQRAAVLRSFYTCDAAPQTNLTEGTGWRLVGPLRHS
jgi:hypothetical protein